MLKGIIKISLLGVMLHFLIEYRIWLDWDKKIVVRNRPGPCHTIKNTGGSEDVTYIGDNTVLFSWGLGLPQGGINAINVTDSSVYEVNITNPPVVEDFMKDAHGISVWKDPKTGHMTLFVITHPTKGDRVEVFDIQTPLELRYRKSITDVKFGFSNDLVAIDAERFYITKMFHYRDTNRNIVEFFCRLRFGTVMFYDGFKAREVATNLFMPNGINISPDKQVIYVAEFGAKKLLGYRRDKTNNLARVWVVKPWMTMAEIAMTFVKLSLKSTKEVDTDTGVDNIEVDHVTGNLWIGSHPLTWTRMDLYNWFQIVSPTEILHVKMSDNMVDNISSVFVDDGSEATGSSSATLVNGRLVIGTVCDQTLICDVGP